MPAASPAEVRALYRQILRAAAEWPSKKRAAIIEEIRAEFRANASAPPGPRADELVAGARAGLQTLRRQTAARHSSSFDFQ